MTFSILQNFTMTIPEDVNNNFYHVAQGTLTPKGGTYLEATNAAYDIGSTSYRFNDAFINNVNAATSVKNSAELNLIIQLVSEVYPTTNRVAITGINGDLSAALEIVVYAAHANNTAMSCYLNINGDSTASHYTDKYFRNFGIWYLTTSASVPRLMSFHGATTGTQNGMGVCTLFTKTGSIRTGRTNRAIHCNGSVIGNFEVAAFVWSNTTSTITSLVFTFETIPSYAYIGIWRRG